MYNVSDNPQVRYSLQLLSAALFFEMNHKAIADITVTQLCKRAQVARNTFYRHCTTKEDLIDFRINAEVSDLIQGVDWTLRDPLAAFQNFFLFWQERQELLLTLYRHGLFSRLSAVLIRRDLEVNYLYIEQLLKRSQDPESLHTMHSAFYTGGLCQMLEQWAGENFLSPLSTLIEVIRELAPVRKWISESE